MKPHFCSLYRATIDGELEDGLIIIVDRGWIGYHKRMMKSSPWIMINLMDVAIPHRALQGMESFDNLQQ